MIDPPLAGSRDRLHDPLRIAAAWISCIDQHRFTGRSHHEGRRAPLHIDPDDFKGSLSRPGDLRNRQRADDKQQANSVDHWFQSKDAKFQI
jgi:hypothetical protein